MFIDPREDQRKGFFFLASKDGLFLYFTGCKKKKWGFV
jgi:hypothetical protein